MNETQTRAVYIDPALKEAGWGVVEGSRIYREYPITDGRLIGQGRREKPKSADYVLIFRNKILAVVEAKAKNKRYTEGVGQAKDYAGRLDVRYTYSTNGQRIYEIDMEQVAEGEVDKYPSPDELWEKTYPTPKENYKIEISDWKEAFESVPYQLFKGKYLPRYYQRVAIERTLDAIANKKDRLLLTMATGTGKTATAFHICWKLFHAKWNLRRDGKRRPRILFLADRNLLANQAFNSFGDFEDDALVRITPSEIKKKNKKLNKDNKEGTKPKVKVPKSGNIFFTIFQSFMAGENEVTSYYEEYPKDYFDLIIIDECHRGGANDESSWRGILEYFSPAVQLGLTATPKRDVNVDTYDYFGDPLYTYKLKDGINDGFLSPFKVKEIDTTIDEYQYTPDDKVKSGEVNEDKVYTESDFNRNIEIEKREEYRVKLFMDIINQNQKTLVFCATQDHAAMVRDLINQYSNSMSPNYCHRVTANDGKLGEQHLSDFQDNEKSIPTILTTSQKLSTGVDAPEIRNIVLMRPVNSMVEFKQIVGRGTRLYDGKDYFTIFDFVKAHQHFQDPEWDGEPQEPEPTTGGTRKPCSVCKESPCKCEKPDPEPCPDCGYLECICEGGEEEEKMVRIKISESKFLEIDSMIKTTFWSPTGKPISSGDFIKQLYGDIPTFFKDEEELRKIWSLPDTRKKLLEELSENGYSNQQLEELRKVISGGKDSDLFDVLSYVAYHKTVVPRLDRATKAKVQIQNYNPKQQEFLNFVLEQYVSKGVEELDESKLPVLLTLKYNAISDAKRALGDIKSIRENFIGFQEHLYGDKAG